MTKKGPPAHCGRVDGKTQMIQLTRLNNTPLMVNSDLIKFVEQSPDTVITLLNNEKILVREDAATVLSRVVQFRRSVFAGMASTASEAASMNKETQAAEPAER